MGSAARFLALWLAAVGTVACAATPRGVAAGHPPRTASTAVRRTDVPGLANLGQVDAGLWRSAQPTEEGFRSARALGIRTVLCLRSHRDDARLAREAGLDLVRLPMRQWSVDEADLVAALEVLCDPSRRPILVHCAHGRDRTGVVVAAYRRVVQDWTVEDALREMREFGAGPWWLHLPGLVRDLDVPGVRARLRAASGPDAGPPARPPADGQASGTAR